MSNDHAKDSGALSTEVAKQFISLALGGVAFVTGLVFSGKAEISLGSLSVIYICFGSSSIFGLLFLMNRVALISQDGKYDPFAGLPRTFSTIQILAFLAGVVWLSVLTVKEISEINQPADSRVLEIMVDEDTVRYPVPDSGRIEVVVSDSIGIRVTQNP